MGELANRIPEHIGPFRVLRAIAKGGVAEVYAVEDPTSGERFALKLLISVKAALRRFDREYEAMTRLNHPGIVRVYHYGIHQGQPWLTMELLRGVPAQPWVKRLGMPGVEARTEEVLRLGYHLSRALHYAHERGLVHRDLKSGNVLVLPDRRVKLVDFGTAYLNDAIDRMTADGEFVGTYAYASPEQLQGRTVDGRSDLYSLGVLLYRLATGRRPYSTNDARKLVDSHLHGPVPDPRMLVPDLKPGVAELVMQLMQKDPAARPRTAGDVATRLESLAGHPFSVRSPIAMHDLQVTRRDAEVRQIRRAMEEAAGATVILLGERGSDRDRLLEMLVHEAVERRDVVFRSHLESGTDLDGLMALLKDIAREGTEDRSAVRALRKLVKANMTQLATPKVRAALRRSVRAAILQVSEGRPIVLAMFGLEHATTLTLEVLANVRAYARESGLRVHLLASCSMQALHRNPDIARRLPDALRVELPPLRPREIALGVGAMLGRRPPPAVLSLELYEATDGQPEYVEDAVRALVATGGLEADDGNRLAWAGAQVDVPVPERARIDAEALLATQPILHRRVLEALALLDPEVPLELLADALDWEVEAVRWVVQALVDAQILGWSVEGRSVVWVRGRLRGVLEDVLRGPRRVAHTETLARAVFRQPPTAAQVRLLLATGDAEEAFRRCTVAARVSIQAGQYRAALAMLTPLFRWEHGIERELVAEAHLLNAHCLHVLRPLDSAAARSLAIARKTLGSDPTRLTELELVSAWLAAAIGHHHNHDKHLDAAWEADQGPPALRARVALEQATLARLRGAATPCADWLERAREAALEAEDRALMGRVTIAVARLSLLSGHPEDAEAAAGKAMQFFEREGDLQGTFAAISAWAESLRRQGRWSEALALLTQRLPEARLSEDPRYYLQMLLAAAWCEIDLSRLGRAQELVDELTATLRQGEQLALQLGARLVYGRILLASGQFMNAAFVLKEVHDRARNARLTVLAETSRALWGETSWHLRDRTHARELFQSALLGLQATDARMPLAAACAARARVLARDVPPEELFAPVSDLLDGGHLPVIALERTLAEGVWQRHQGDRSAMAGVYRKAALALNRLASGLNDTDRAALRVHPWSRRIRRGLR